MGRGEDGGEGEGGGGGKFCQQLCLQICRPKINLCCQLAICLAADNLLFEPVF